jgi:hypothetical protein
MEKINKTSAATKIQNAIRNKYAKLTTKITRMEMQRLFVEWYQENFENLESN